MTDAQSAVNEYFGFDSGVFAEGRDLVFRHLAGENDAGESDGVKGFDSSKDVQVVVSL